ncbi:MAG: hypothetical protein Q4C96_08445 [Planctomycetia bacterium]|nr:hypothetical protein [Planctomycetia bacterium]
MNFRIFIVICMTFFGAFSVFGNTPDSTEIRRLVRQLNAPQSDVRQAAEETLKNFGPAILPLLPSDEALKAGAPETELRVKRIRQEIQKQISLDVLEPASVVMPEGEKTFHEWLTWLKTETGNDILEGFPSSDKKISAMKFSLPFQSFQGEAVAQNPQRILFWNILDRIADSVRYTTQFREMEPKIYLVPSRSKVPRTGILPVNPPEVSQNPWVTYVGPFRMAPQKLTSSLLLTEDIHSTQLQTEIAWEPRLTAIFLNVQLSKILAVNSHVPSVSVKNSSSAVSSGEKNDLHELKFLSRVHEVPVGINTIFTNFDIPLTVTDPTDWEILRTASAVTVQGKLSAVIAGAKYPFTFTDLERKVNRMFPAETQYVASVLVTFSRLRKEVKPSAQDVEKKENMLVATLRYRYHEAHGAMESHRTWVYQNPAWLESPTGQKIESTGYELLRQTTNEISLDLYFPQPNEDLKGWKLVFPRSTGIYAVEYDFQMKDIPCP